MQQGLDIIFKEGQSAPLGVTLQHVHLAIQRYKSTSFTTINDIKHDQVYLASLEVGLSYYTQVNSHLPEVFFPPCARDPSSQATVGLSLDRHQA